MVTKKQLERERKATEARREKNRNIRGVVFSAVGVASGFGVAGYFNLAASPSFTVGVLLLGFTLIFLCIAAWEFFRSKVVKVGSIIALIFAFFWCKGWAQGQWKQKVIADIKMGLQTKVAIPTSKNPLESLISIVNDSHTDIASHTVVCRIINIVAGNRNVVENVSSQVLAYNEKLEVGGDADTRGCLTGENGTMTLKVDRVPRNICIDMMVRVEFRAADSIEAEDFKESRFVYGYLGNNDWEKESSTRRSSYCKPLP
jgi:hypothetical protein